MFSDLFGDPHRRHFLLTVLVGAGLAAYVTGSVRALMGFDLALILALVGGYPIFATAVGSLFRRKITADLAVALAALAALWIGQYDVAAEVIFIMLIGESLEHYAVGRTRAGIASLLALRPETARVRRDDVVMVIPAKEIQAGDVVLLRPGDKIPVDGRVLTGNSAVDQSTITGEHLPVDKAPGDEVFAGTINLNGSLVVAVERLGHETTLEKIIHLVEHAEEAKAPAQRLADRYASWFVPIVLIAAAAAYLITRDVSRSVTILVVACPCALVLATPTAVAATLGGLVRKGVLAKGGAVLETLGRVQAVVFDKTGTLTQAKLRLAEVAAFDGVEKSDVLATAAAVESHSEHPIAQVIVEAAENLSVPPVEAFEALPGLGAKGVVDGKLVWVGNRRLVEQCGAAWSEDVSQTAQRLAGEGGSVVYVVQEDRVIGLIAVADTLRPEAPTAVARLRRYGVERIAMLTGDTRPAAAMVASRLGIDDVRAELLPAEKVEAIRDIRRNYQPVAMVGDGINDAPSLAAADVGIAPAEMGADVTIEAADLILVGDDLRKLAEAVRRSRLMLKVIWQNIIAFALLFNIAAVLAAAMGWISPVAGAIIHQVSSLTVVLNSLRLLVDGHEIKHRWKHFREDVRRRRPLWAGGTVAIALLAYAASGVYVVGPNETAIVRVFGRYVGEPVGPGLHVTWPYPLGKVDRVRTALTRRVPIGFRVQEGLAAEPPSYEWNVQHRGGQYTRVPEEAELWAGDQNLVDINVIVQYQVVDPATALFSAGGSDDTRRRLATDLRNVWSALLGWVRRPPVEPKPAAPVPTDAAQTATASEPVPPQVLPDVTKENRWDRLVRAACEACLREEMARRESDAVLASDRHELEDMIAAAAQAKLDAWKTGLKIESVCLGDIHPPLEVVSAFRDVAAAMEEKEAAISEALAYQAEKDRQSRAEAAATKARGEAEKTQAISVAQGEAARLGALAEAYRIDPQAAEFRHRIETQESILSGRRKWILDAGTGSRRVWWWPGATGLLPQPSPVEPELPPDAYNP